MTASNLSSKRVLVLVDGQNVLGYLHTARYRRIDAQAFMSWCATFGRPTVKWFQGGWNGTERVFPHLRSAGIEVISKTPKTLPGGNRKADMDMEMGLAASDAVGIYDTVMLVTADGDFVPVVERLRRSNVDVHLLSPTARTARELLRAVDPHNIHDLAAELTWFGFNPPEAA